MKPYREVIQVKVVARLMRYTLDGQGTYCMGRTEKVIESDAGLAEASFIGVAKYAAAECGGMIRETVDELLAKFWRRG